jgi:hypothetical protein
LNLAVLSDWVRKDSRVVEFEVVMSDLKNASGPGVQETVLLSLLGSE